MALLGFNQTLTNSSIAPALEETAYILTRSTEPNGAGGVRETFVKGLAVKCDIAPKAGGKFVGRAGRGEKVAADERIDERTDNVLTFPAGTEVNERDRVEVVGRGLFEVLVLYRRSVEIARQV